MSTHVQDSSFSVLPCVCFFPRCSIAERQHCSATLWLEVTYPVPEAQPRTITAVEM